MYPEQISPAPDFLLFFLNQLAVLVEQLTSAFHRLGGKEQEDSSAGILLLFAFPVFHYVGNLTVQYSAQHVYRVGGYVLPATDGVIVGHGKAHLA